MKGIKYFGIVVFIAVLTFAACSSKPIALASTSGSVLVSDKTNILDGEWQFSADLNSKIVFFGDTWRYFENDELKLNGVLVLRGNNEVLLMQLVDRGFIIRFNITENTLIVNSTEGGNSWMVGIWNKIGTGKIFSEINPFVGTWKVVDDYGTMIYQIYSNGTGIGWECTEDFWIISYINLTYDKNNVSNTGIFLLNVVEYDLEKRDGTGILQEVTANYELNGNRLRIHNTVYERQ